MIEPWRRERLKRQLAAATPEHRAWAFRFYGKLMRDPCRVTLDRNVGRRDGDCKITLLSMILDPTGTIPSEETGPDHYVLS